MTDTVAPPAAGAAAATARRTRLLLVNPRFPESFWSFRWAMDTVLPGKRTLNPPLGLATLAALCPPDWDVRIVDENVTSVPLEPEVDLIGVGGMAVQFARSRELLRYYRRKGYRTVAGGSYASLCPERYADLADTVVAGEAEYLWPQFCRDVAHGSVRRLYRETGTVDLTRSPTPRFDLLDVGKYSAVAVQYSRGCPFRCEFCDIVVMFGRRPRTKTVEQIGRELDRLRALRVRNVFFVDDNLIGNQAAAKALLRYLAGYQRRHDYRFAFGTQASVNLADSEELLRLFREANFAWVFLGIESPDSESLKETKKTQNLRRDLLTAVRRVHGVGIDVLGGFIVGFDNDTLESFDRQFAFIVAAGIPVAMVGLLTALPKTPLHARLSAEGRLIAGADAGDNTKAGTNFHPKRMAYATMIQAYKRFCLRLYDDRSLGERIRNKSKYLGHATAQAGYAWRQQVGIAARLLVRGVLRGGPRRAFEFARSFAGASPRLWSRIVVDWIAGLALRDYVRRHFGDDAGRTHRMAADIHARLRRAGRGHVRSGALRVTLRTTADAGARLGLTLNGALDRRFFAVCGRRLKRLLRTSAATVALSIEALREDQQRYLQRLLRRLERHGNRVSIWVAEEVRPRVAIDSSVFHLVLDRHAANGA